MNQETLLDKLEKKDILSHYFVTFVTDIFLFLSLYFLLNLTVFVKFHNSYDLILN